MKSQSKRVAASLAAALVVAATGVTLAIRVWAQDATAVEFQSFEADGFQSSSDAPLLIQGNAGIGNNATLEVVLGPVLGNVFGIIPPSSPGTASAATAPYLGANCKAEFSQDVIKTSDFGTSKIGISGSLLLDVYGLRCEPNAGGHVKNGVYSVTGGTGQFEGLIGAGNIVFDARSDGSTLVHLAGNLARKITVIPGKK